MRIGEVAQGILKFNRFDALKVLYLLDGVLVKGLAVFLRQLNFARESLNLNLQFADPLPARLVVINTRKSSTLDRRKPDSPMPAPVALANESRSAADLARYSLCCSKSSCLPSRVRSSVLTAWMYASMSRRLVR